MNFVFAMLEFIINSAQNFKIQPADKIIYKIKFSLRILRFGIFAFLMHKKFLNFFFAFKGRGGENLPLKAYFVAFLRACFGVG